MVNLKIDGKNVVVPEGTTILDAAKQAGIDIPTLCFLKEINEVGDCRMCIVEVEGRKGFATSCIQKVEEGMVVHTHTPNVLEARHTILDLIISNHSKDCLTCTRSGNCELQDLAIKFNTKSILKLCVLTSNLGEKINLITALFLLKNNGKINIFNKVWLQKYHCSKQFY